MRFNYAAKDVIWKRMAFSAEAWRASYHNNLHYTFELKHFNQ